MKCRDVERWLVLGNEDAADADARNSLRAHLEACPRCARLAKELDGLRGGLAGSVRPEPPVALVEKTRRLCVERLAALEASPAEASQSPARAGGLSNGALRRIPPAVWAATAGLLLLTGFFFTPFFGETLRSEPLSYASWVGLGFIVQNVFMLFFSPLLLRRRRRTEARA